MSPYCLEHPWVHIAGCNIHNLNKTRVQMVLNIWVYEVMTQLCVIVTDVYMSFIVFYNMRG